MKSTTFVLLQALALGALAAPAPKDTPKMDYHKGLTREQEGRELNNLIRGDSGVDECTNTG